MTSTMSDIPEPVVVRFPTIMSGAVLRWYYSVEDAEKGDEACSASRDGVLERADDTTPFEWLDEAQKVADLLKRQGHDADTSAWETHERSSLFGPIVPKAEEGAEQVTMKKGTPE